MSKENVMDAMRENEESTPPETQTEETAKPQEESKPKKEKSKAEAAWKKEKEAMQAQLDECNDKYLRMMAEYDNFRRRAAKEKEGVYGDAYADALKEVLPVMDNLERAAQFAQQDPDSPLAAGVTMTLNQFSQAMCKLGVEAVGEAGETFDPNLHNAVMHVEDESLPDNVIAEVLQKGYRKGDRVIRYAMVKVAN